MIPSGSNLGNFCDLISMGRATISFVAGPMVSKALQMAHLPLHWIHLDSTGTEGTTLRVRLGLLVTDNAFEIFHLP
jgi:hypothetical protein